ncbi:prolipoprotein diacylglyceryl transferase [Lachnospiraceae bacterium]|uniref:prolipoprotein diacylglyceryl transferase n=1 Tax=Extibacter sp. GGCC_0201 TaxID=2731209 RepID=UPI001AA13F56|nr:prolipoprotein diacylglyceryl transferase [Extibacter sp. GGCC_0201]MBO1721421.1 prolipoprotein diacylglyceryl transferase [Extibacter sp. GGCC_0201]BDF34928.1 prolipoprotein diacylglyceryl transferase [Lachnospiraceae bacterium]BDF38930.1 prolipoprotein diacylglyceryl transferase [Lachnospiraceae bacterium]
MHRTIDFPNIGIHLKSVGDHITVFGFDITYYGMLIGLGILAGIFIAAAEAKRSGQNSEDYFDLAIYAVIFSIIGARIYYVIFSWDMYKDDLLSIFNTRQGGLAIYGGVIAAVITVIIYARIKKMSAPLIFDTAGLGLVAGQMIGRWGNFFNREAFGEYTNNLLAMKLPVDAVRGSDITELMRKHMEQVDGVSYIQVHPTFLYESLWCLMVLVIMLIYRKYKKFDGEVFLIYLLGYGVGRAWIEGLRTDQLLLPGVGWPVSQVLAGIIAVVSLGLIIYKRYKIRQETEREQR